MLWEWEPHAVVHACLCHNPQVFCFNLLSLSAPFHSWFPFWLIHPYSPILAVTFANDPLPHPNLRLHCRGVKKILPEWNLCSSRTIDEDLRVMADNHIFTWQKARPESYSDRLEEFASLGPHNVTKGIFVQYQGFVSFSQNGFRMNGRIWP